jgi:hypothetical protein
MLSPDRVLTADVSAVEPHGYATSPLVIVGIAERVGCEACDLYPGLGYPKASNGICSLLILLSVRKLTGGSCLRATFSGGVRSAVLGDGSLVTRVAD